MAPLTRRRSIFIPREENPTMAKFLAEIKKRHGEKQPIVMPVQRKKKTKRVSLYRVVLKDANDRQLNEPPPNPGGSYLDEIRAATLALKEVGYRIEGGVIIIDD